MKDFVLKYNKRMYERDQSHMRNVDLINITGKLIGSVSSR